MAAYLKKRSCQQSAIQTHRGNHDANIGHSINSRASTIAVTTAYRFNQNFHCGIAFRTDTAREMHDDIRQHCSRHSNSSS